MEKMRLFVFLCLFVLMFGKLSAAARDTVGSKENVSLWKNTTNTVTSAASIVNQVVTTTSRPLLPGLRLPCVCEAGQCGCCTGAILDQINQKACLNLTYEPDDFSFTATMSMNKRVLYKRTVSGKNPPPMCFRLPRFDFIRFCVTLSNIYFAGRNVHLCIDMEADWAELTLVEWSFDCIRMGASGVAVVGPEEGGGVPASPVDAVDQTDEDYDDSARNVPLNLRKDALTHCNTLIFDESVKRADRRNVDKTLIRVKKLHNGNVVVAYGKKEV